MPQTSHKPGNVVGQDGGYGWIVVISAFIISFLTDGIIFSFGLVLVELVEAFGLSRASTALVGSIMNAFGHLIGPVAGSMLDVLGGRGVVIAGTLLGFVGVFSSFFVNSFGLLYLTYGVIAGIGMGMMYAPANAAVIKHFNKRRTLAQGIAMCGTGFGTFVMNLLGGYLIRTYGWRGAILINSALLLNGLACGLVLIPPTKQHSGLILDIDDSETDNAVTIENKQLVTMKIYLEHEYTVVNSTEEIDNQAVPIPVKQVTDKDTTKASLLENENIDTSMATIEEVYEHDKESTAVLTNLNNDVILINKETDDKITNDEDETTTVDQHERRANTSTFKELLDFSALKDYRCMFFLASTFFINLAFALPFALLPDQVIQDGVSPYKASWLVSTIGFTNTISRIVNGFIGDRRCVNRLLMFETFVFCCGIVLAVSPVFRTFETKLIFSCLYGVFIGGYIILLPVVFADMFGKEIIGKTFGMNRFVIGLADLVAAPIGGWIFDSTGSYTLTFIIAGCEYILGGILLVCPSIIKRCGLKSY